MISNKQIQELTSLATPEELDIFFTRLNYNYGGGEVLSFKQIESFLEKKMHTTTTVDMLTVYVDTIRMLRLLKKDENEVLGLDENSIKSLHDKLSSEYGNTITEIKSAEYKESIAPFINLTGDYGTVRVELISSLKELNDEGSSMNHCIATYSDIIIRKQYVGFRVINKENKERLTLGCLRGPNSNLLFFNQLKGWGNSPASKESCNGIIEFCDLNKITIPYSESFDLRPALV